MPDDRPSREEEEPVVVDADELDEEVGEEIRYTISSYGADYPVDSLVQRIETKHIIVPTFQRGYVWTLPQASRFVESLLLGLPVPGIFLSRIEETQQLEVIDGQQRLWTLYYFKKGLFRGRQFALQDVQQSLRGKTYESLSPEDVRRLNDAIIHATIIRQEGPPGDRSSVFSVFSRLNTGATLLQEQEIRSAIYQGELIDLLKELNRRSTWREIYGPVSKRAKDQELILRFFALLFKEGEYVRPMKSFLNKYVEFNRHCERQTARELTEVFDKTIELVRTALGDKPFRPQGNINAAVFDSVMVALARRQRTGPLKDTADVHRIYDQLLENKDFQKAYSKATANLESLHGRLDRATAAFAVAP